MVRLFHYLTWSDADEPSRTNKLESTNSSAGRDAAMYPDLPDFQGIESNPEEKERPDIEAGGSTSRDGRVQPLKTLS